LFFRYIGALYYTEASLVYATRHQSKMLHGVWGDDVDTRYFDEHTHIDKHHGRMVIDNIIKPVVEQCGESVIPEIVRGFEEFRLLQEMADEDLIAQIAWSDQREASKAQAQQLLADDDATARKRPWKAFHEVEDEISITHVHEADELFVVDEGELDFVTGHEQTLRLGPGEGIIIPRHRLHGSIVTSQECAYRVSPIEAGEPCSS
jgi:mannose-6-phosphate isomerase-like protein (cupin superfamily)